MRPHKPCRARRGAGRTSRRSSSASTCGRSTWCSWWAATAAMRARRFAHARAAVQVCVPGHDPVPALQLATQTTLPISLWWKLPPVKGWRPHVAAVCSAGSLTAEKRMLLHVLSGNIQVQHNYCSHYQQAEVPTASVSLHCAEYLCCTCMQAIQAECERSGVVCSVVGVPKSIDNDILLARTPKHGGFNYVVPL